MPKLVDYSASIMIQDVKKKLDCTSLDCKHHSAVYLDDH